MSPAKSPSVHHENGAAISELFLEDVWLRSLNRLPSLSRKDKPQAS